MWAADCTVFVCEYQRRYCMRRGLRSRRNTMIHNGVDTQHFQDTTSAAERQALRAALGYANTDYVIGIAPRCGPRRTTSSW